MRLPMNTSLAMLKPSGIRRINALAARHPGCIAPDFPTPDAISAEVTAALDRGDTHYPPNNGRPALRDALSKYMDDAGLAFSADEVILTDGATEALSATFMAMLNPGDEVIIPTPAFGLYESIVVANHAKAVFLDTEPAQFQIDEDALSACVTPATKAIVICSPNNPTGCILDTASLDAVARVAEQAGIYVVCDDVYNRLVYVDGYERFAQRHPELREQTVVIESFSKPWAMTGWRLGWLAAAAPVIAEIAKAHQYLVSSAVSFEMDAAARALTVDPTSMLKVYRARRERVLAALYAMGLDVVEPAGAFYTFPSIKKFGLTSEDFCIKAIEEAKADTTRPSFITIHTQIGYGCPAKQGKASAHGEPLGEENIEAMKDFLGWPSKEPFYVPQEVYDHYAKAAEEKAETEAAWNVMFAAYCQEYPEMEALWNQYYGDTDELAKALMEDDSFWANSEKAEATRNLSGKIINKLKDRMPNLIGGSADLAPSNKTNMSDAGDFSKADYAGRNMHFGVRELAMTAIGNGMMLHGGLRTYVSTFFVFSDYTKPMARLSALMKMPLTFVFTHDSIGVGEDGPTHEPIEQLAMFRAMPNFHVFRPCDATETAAAWYSAVTSKTTPTALVLSRQNLAPMPGSCKDALKGGYVIDDCEGTPDLILIASGSEVELSVKAKEILAAEGRKVRVVSMPCMDLFEEQSAEYKESVLPKEVRKRVAVEALSDFGWGKYVGLDGACVTMTGFGASGPAAQLFEHFGFTAEHVADVARSL